MASVVAESSRKDRVVAGQAVACVVAGRGVSCAAAGPAVACVREGSSSDLCGSRIHQWPPW